ncbi:MAG: universal stress protein [Desulfobulbaceae bacterium]|nr:universal stress protein [Desulfobulbaceae bacterium]
MEKQILVTVSNDTTLYGIGFVCSFFKNLDETKITLLCVTSESQLNTRSDIEKAWYSPDELKKSTLSSKQKRALDAAEKMFCKHGFSDQNMEIKITSKKQSIVKDIVREGHAGHYDAVVLGRVGTSAFERILSEKVTDSILSESIDFPVWICREPEWGRKNVLLCVDGSDSSLRIADHVGFILAGEPEHGVTIFHVNRGQDLDREKMFNDTQHILEKNGVEPGQICRKTVSSLRIVHTVEAEALSNGYAAVATGLTGRHKGKIQQWLAGTITMELLKRLDKVALWTCR